MSNRSCGAIAAAAVMAAGLLAAVSVHAQSSAALSDADKAARRAALQRQLELVNEELRKLDGAAPEPATAQTGAPSRAPASPRQATVPEVVVTSSPLPTIAAKPTGQTMTTIDRDLFNDSPAFSAGQILQYSPGVTTKQGNGPRDVGISIRGSNARNGFAVRNIQVFEDGFPVTQPDGLSRTDLTDPHAYGSIDVYRGPSSALFGNYATGGAINFNTRRGGEIRGLEFGSDFGSFGYNNNYVSFGNKAGNFEYSVFGSYVRSDGFISNQEFNTATENLLLSYSPTADDKLTFKLVNNDLDTNLPIRLSLNQFRTNPYQKGCTAGATAAAGCGTVALLLNGFSGATTAQTAEQAGLSRHDRRTVVGARWEHSVDKDTVLRTQFVFDSRDINQPTGTTSARGDFPSFNVSSDVTQQAKVFGLDATHFVGAYFNYEDNNGNTFNVVPGGNARTGALTNTTFGHHYNIGARGREEIRFNQHWTAVLGIGVEYTDIDALNSAYSYATAVPTITRVLGQRSFVNVAPEAALEFRPDDQWTLRTRVSTGFGTPNIGQLFVTPAGVNGNNTQLESQTNLGIDVGADWSPHRTLTVGVTGFYEFFENEFVTQSPGAGLLGFTFNVPRSEHRGIEATALWRPVPGWALRLAYLLDDQYYTDYTERLSAGALSTAFNRAGNKIPGVEPHLASARLSYDHPEGVLAGLGGFIEYTFRDGFFIDNGNLAKAPGVQLVNLNAHYNPEFDGSLLKTLRLFFEVQNVFDRTYIASANNVTNSISAATGLQNPGSVVAASTGSIYTGAPRTFFGGFRLKF